MTEKPDLVEGLIVKPGVHGRRTYSRAAKRELVQRCQAPGVSVAGLAMAHGINANLLRRWMVRYGEESGDVMEPRPQRRAALLPVKMVEPSTAPAAVTDSLIEITFRSATIRLRGRVDMQALSAVLDCLAQRG
jgi:transposase